MSAAAQSPDATARVAGFVAMLRENGAKLGPRETEQALLALGHVAAGDPGEARLALKAALVHDARSWERFDDLFEAYWSGAGRVKERAAPSARIVRRSARPALWDAHLPPDTDESAGAPVTPEGGGEDASEGEGRLIATETENLIRKDLRELVSPEEIKAAEEAALRLARALRDRVSRRRRAAASGRQLDLRRTIRRSLGAGGEPIRLLRRRRVERPIRIVALLDVSGSMTLYSRVFLSFLKGLIGQRTRADGYVFHTRLMRVTDALRDRDTLRALGRLTLMAEGFGGGTRIAGALAAFNDHHAKTALDDRTVVFILSDGYDTDPPARLAAELARLKKRARRIVWVNPLLGWRGYAPVAAGMEAALPYLDAFLAANTLERLAAIEPEIAKL